MVSLETVILKYLIIEKVGSFGNNKLRNQTQQYLIFNCAVYLIAISCTIASFFELKYFRLRHHRDIWQFKRLSGTTFFKVPHKVLAIFQWMLVFSLSPITHFKVLLSPSLFYSHWDRDSNLEAVVIVYFSIKLLLNTSLCGRNAEWMRYKNLKKTRGKRIGTSLN